MSIFYKSMRVGKDGKLFSMYKLRTLKETSDSFASDQTYTRFGKFLRKYKFDELPQVWNVLKGDCSLVGPRPEEQRTIDVIPESVREILLSVKPGLTSLASLHFFDEEALIRKSSDPFKDYWTKVKPMKIALDMFYIENRCFSLKIWVLWQTFKKIIKSIFQ